jgi:diacylglycerol kinase (ATP)
VELLSGSAFLIVNPAARRARRALARARTAFAAAGVSVEVAFTDGAGDAARLAAAVPAAVPAVFVLGGDGTVMEVLGALAHTGRPVGILPGGTGNLVAHAIGVPRDAGRAAARLLRGRPARFDLGMLANGRRFAFSASVGVDARMIADTPAAAKRLFGVGAYAFTAVRAMLACRRFGVRAEVDGAAQEGYAADVMVANLGRVLGGLLVLGPDIRGDDGCLDLCVFSPEHAREAMAVAGRLVRRRFTGTRALGYRRGRAFRITCDPPQLVQADGEVIGSTPFEACVEPGAATLLVPADRD